MSAVPLNSVQRQLGRRSGWFAVPGWVISLILHGSLLGLLAVSLQAPSRYGDPGGIEGMIGVYFDPNGQGGDAPGQGDGTGIGEPGEQELVAEPGGSAPGGGLGEAELRMDAAPPVRLELPSTIATRSGPGLGRPSASYSGDARDLVRSRGAGSGGAGRGIRGDGEGDGNGGGSGGGGGGGGTSFFGSQGYGRRFLYVLDASGSMQDYNALAVAKAELLASLAQLNAEQQFQVIFYSEKSYPMTNHEGKSQLFWGTDIHRTRASQFVRGIQPMAGTRHYDALTLALSYNPDVIFFLTDAGEPPLHPGELDKLKRRNNGRTQIHVIEFGKLGDLQTESFLKKLARENGGKHIYRDVTKFDAE